MRNESVQTFAGVLSVGGSGAGKGAETSALGIGCVVEEVPDVIEVYWDVPSKLGCRGNRGA
jgi:hypothetical protein